MALRRVIVRGYANMWRVRVALLLGAAAALAGCAGGPKADTPPGVNLAGSWKLNHALGDDPQQVIAKMRAQALKIVARQSAAADDVPRAGPARTQSQDANPVLGNDDPGAAGGRGARRPDVLRYSPMTHALTQVVERGDFLTVRQTSEQLVFDYGTTVRSFTPGARSVVSAEMGVADQVSGWNGRDYVINIKAQLGPSIVDSYGLSPDGRRLIEKLTIGPAELPRISLTRVYERTTETAPRAPQPAD
jgi:hypothetical protein